MADPVTGLAALGAVASVLQIVDFAASLTKETYELLKSSKGTLRENDRIETLTVTYSNLAEQALDPGDYSPQPDKAEQAINNLANECKKASGDLLDLLKGLQVTKGLRGTQKVVQSVSKAKRSRQQRHSIEQKQKYLTEVNGQLSTAVLIQLKHSSVTGLRQVFRRVSDAESKNTAVVVDAKDAILNALNGDHDKKKCACILESLWFREMKLRREAIPRAHRRTFSWLFSESSPFQEWLESERDIFWVTGKAGSGKSTLMKFLGGHKKAQSLLSSWAGSRKLVLAQNYLWNPGLSIQRNEEGMLQDILFQILNSERDLVPIATPRRWHDDLCRLREAEPWDRDELIQALTNVFENSNSTTCYCLFIDGLDEYEGEHSQLVSTVVGLSKHANVKICVSSRSWNVFWNAFDQLPDKLYLHQLTRYDIEAYAQDELVNCLGHSALTNDLVSIITDKAAGVFLWVFLVIRSLREGYEEGDDAEFMRQRVSEFPSDLEDYFKHVLKRVSPTYKKRMVKALGLALRIFNRDHSIAMKDSNSFISFWLLSQGVFDDPKGPFELPLRNDKLPWFGDQVDQVELTRKYLSACCRDFLHMEGSTVDYIHRTVYDFLRTPELQEILQRDTPQHFDNKMFFAEVALARHKVKGFSEVFQATDPAGEIKDSFMWAAIKKIINHDESLLVLSEYERLAIFWTDRRHNPGAGISNRKVMKVLAAFASHKLHAFLYHVSKNWKSMHAFDGKDLVEAAVGLSKYHNFPAYAVDLTALEYIVACAFDSAYGKGLISSDAGHSKNKHAVYLEQQLEQSSSWSAEQKEHCKETLEFLRNGWKKWLVPSGRPKLTYVKRIHERIPHIPDLESAEPCAADTQNMPIRSSSQTARHDDIRL